MSALKANATTGLSLAALAALLLWPAFWNGAPLFYYDSVDYLEMPFTGRLPVFRTAPYGWFQWFARISGSLWVPLILQALMVAAMVWLSARSFVPRLSPWLFLFGTGLLAAFTGWAWYVSQIMADSVTGAVLLAAVALLCGERLPRGQRWVLIGLTAIGISFHLSHLAVVCGLFVVAVLARLVLRRVRNSVPLRLGDLAATITLAIVIAVTANYAATGRIFLFRDPANLRLALFVETGLVQRYLDDVCPGNDKASLLCPYRQRIPTTANAYLWNTFGPFHELGGWRSEPHKQEAKAIVREILSRYPGETVIRLGKAAFVQFGLVETGDGIRPMHWHLEKSIRRLYLDFVDDFLGAHQQHVIDFHGYAARDTILYWTSLFAMLFFAISRWLSGSRWPAMAALFVFLALAGNAIVCGAFSNPNHRYQGRVAWLPLLLVLLSGAEMTGLRLSRDWSGPAEG
ncbi:MAG: hypothetical protein O9322_12225 [Beijerinckiaceae bacterium]|nr:hypothetical protein [Beijerinckiaceae bacterium]MCZ8300105.1 hypothetical protein [Beijerinckiaceae bacterium]